MFLVSLRQLPRSGGCRLIKLGGSRAIRQRSTHRFTVGMMEQPPIKQAMRIQPNAKGADEAPSVEQ
jgi:hypothetical protein